MPEIRDRIKSFRRVKASDLKASPKNWRVHPEHQKKAMSGILAQVGYADALIARELPDGSLMLIDGHLRAETTPDQKVPVLILDVSEEEADLILATLDPLAALAETDGELLSSLMSSVEVQSDEVRLMLDGILGQIYQPPPDEKVPPEQFREVDDTIEINFVCPKCKYGWSGSAV